MNHQFHKINKHHYIYNKLVIYLYYNRQHMMYNLYHLYKFYILLNIIGILN